MADWEIVSAKETSLGANFFKEYNHQNKWNMKNGQQQQQKDDQESKMNVEPFTITLHPMEIKTFILEVKKASTRF